MSKDIVVIGGGVAGIHASLCLAERYPQSPVHLFEEDSEVGGTLRRTPHRMGLGFHYFDLDTALFYLRETIKFRRMYPDPFCDTGKSYEKGVYVVVKGSEEIPSSIICPEQIDQLYRAIQDEYKSLVDADPRNQVYGDPKDFLVKLDPAQYPAHINRDVAAAVYQTQEVLLNVAEYTKFLQERIKNTPNIILNVNTKIVKLQMGQTVLDEEGATVIDRFIVFAEKQKPGSKPEKFQQGCGYLVNASWQNAESLAETLSPGQYADQQLGAWRKTVVGDRVSWERDAGEKRQNRLKVLVRFRLPESLVEASSAFFCMGSHCMFSNNGDLGKGYPEGHITLADVTNISTSAALGVGAETQCLLSGKASVEEKLAYARSLFTGASRYVSGLNDSEDYLRAGLLSGEIDVHFGIVQTWGPSQESLEDLKAVLDDPGSSLHRRDALRVDPDYPCFGVTRALALKGGSYGPSVGEAVSEAVEEQKQAVKVLSKVMRDIIESSRKQNFSFQTELKEMKKQLLNVRVLLETHVELFKVVAMVHKMFAPKEQSLSLDSQVLDDISVQQEKVPAWQFFKNTEQSFFTLEYREQALLLMNKIDRQCQEIEEDSTKFDFLAKLWDDRVRAYSKTDECLRPDFPPTVSSFFATRALVLKGIECHGLTELGKAVDAYLKSIRPTIIACQGITACIKRLTQPEAYTEEQYSFVRYIRC